LPGWRKRIEARFERFVVGSAALVIANTRSLRDEFRTRYPEQPGPRIEAVYNSVEGTLAPGARGLATPDTRIRLTHAGFLYGPRDPATLLRAVARRRRATADDVAIELVGAVELEYRLDRLLDELAIADIVTVHGPVPHARCSVMLKESDALLLLQPGTRTQLPSKLFEYVTFGKPILTIAERDGETYRFAAEELHAPVGACDDEADIAAAIDRLVDDVRRTGVDSAAWQRMLAAYSASAVTGQFLELLDWVADSKRAIPRSPVQSDPVRSD